jgi:uncharacterized membrane protein YqjE
VGEQRRGIVSDARGVASDALRAVRTRLELVSIEIQEEKARVALQLILASATFFFLSFGMLLAILWLSFSLPEGQRQLVLGCMGIVFLVVGGACALRIRALSGGPRLFDATLQTLKRDEAALEP